MFYGLVRFFFFWYLRAFHLVRISGRERVPLEGPLILCANHTSYFDSMLVALATTRPVRFLIHQRFYHHDILGLFVKGCGAIPVSLNGNDQEAFKRALALLKDGGVLGVFPEGQLSTTGVPGPGKPGAVMLAAASGASMIPISISGAHLVYPKGKKLPRPGRIRVTIHPPVRVDPERRRDKQYLQKMTDTVMGSIESGLSNVASNWPDK